jgi:hypothetical protein
MSDFDKLAQYRCHKVVRAGRVTREADEYSFFVPVRCADGSELRLPMPKGATRAPKAGDYYVVYEDGYTSLSPAKAFEDGYTLISSIGEQPAGEKFVHGPHFPAPAPDIPGLPVAGYRPQHPVAVAAVNANKALEESDLRRLDALAADPAVDKRWLAIGRTHLEQGWMAVNRAIFKPDRVEL